MKKKNKKWIKFRHRVVRNLAFAVLYPYSWLKYGFRVKKFREKPQRQYLILMNHQTAFDQFFLGMAFSGPIYYVASEDLFSKGWVSSLLRYLVAPIPIKKQSTDVHAVMNCLRVAKEGGTIALAPEGNRTFSGKTEYMSPAIAPLARKLGLPILLYHIEGGYGVHPRWSDVVRKGRMRGFVSRVIEPEEYKDLSDDALFALIEQGLYVNEGKDDGIYRHKRLAEYIERAFYYCPFCGLSTFYSEKDKITCQRCHTAVQYLPTKMLVGVERAFPFRFTTAWYDAQSAFMNGLDLTPFYDTPMYEEKASLSEVIVYKKKIPLEKNARLSLYGDRIELRGKETYVFSFDTLSAVSVLGKNKINLYIGKQIFQIKSDKRFNALKYVNTYYHYKNVKKGEDHGKFLGL